MPSPLQFPDSIPLAQCPTPLQALRYRQKQSPNIRLWCKRDDLTGSVLSGNKVRKLEFILADALRQGADTLITCGGLQSNHCRATALVAAQYGLRCRLILRGEQNSASSDGNLLLSELAGAEIEIYSPLEYHANLPQLFLRAEQVVKARGSQPYSIPTGASNDVGLWGYVACARELALDFERHNIHSPLVVCAAGSGGTLAGLSAGLNHFSPGAQVLGVAVCDSAEYFAKRVKADIQAAQARFVDSGLSLPHPPMIVDDYIGPGYAIGYPEVFSVIRDLARSDGLVLDPVYTGKAFYGMLEELAQGRHQQREIVFIHTGGVFGLFPYKNEL
ncbi:1-aminocyclopropane-1-carboxylate deaminase/D-cysteine desulfhydrase [Gilvimarinus sp. 1_MG-2023]|uniref:1-aminocyclopropane-1-carboxylate deaminase/D-cysteine desulfhydrase n=1 Tax=Gilvimarinus sp. 1_MG-2023 TaxID=3062638 RepID=UPI0026E1E958|nr:D-cysteine desulfhydrase family protein [Gilvimarinus sp. 1_MG-2023]MDO6745763.1 D-cysteine desulfhydrase family protein [Gilvimarinus sp. 1_MG-2023]